jgi:malate synthase
MRAYTELLVATCHRRGAHAIGGMAAFIPSRRDAEVNETALARVREDKVREASDGFDGTWVAHPDLVPVATAIFDEVLADRPNQVERPRADVSVAADELLAVSATPGDVTEQGLRTNVNVGLLYLESWLRGVGAAAIYNLMEDAATAEISRSQVWQWTRHGHFTTERVRSVVAEELEAIRELVGGEAFDGGRFAEARQVFEQVALGDDFVDFLTLPAYELLP